MGWRFEVLAQLSFSYLLRRIFMSNQATAHSVTFKRPDGAEVNGYLASPAVLEGAPAIVLIQEWWG